MNVQRGCSEACYLAWGAGVDPRCALGKLPNDLRDRRLASDRDKLRDLVGSINALFRWALVQYGSLRTSLGVAHRPSKA